MNSNYLNSEYESKKKEFENYMKAYKPNIIENKLNIKKLIIFTNGFTLNAANLLSNRLKEISIECLVLKEFISYKYIEAARINPELYLFIFSPQMQLARPGLVKNLPKNKYFLYQIEQLNQNQYPYQSADIIGDQILNSIHTFDYSLTNYNLYPNKLKHKVKLFKPFIDKIDNNNSDKIIDILFIGSINDRRRKILEYLKKKNYKIEVVEKTFGDELINLIKKSKIVLNIHYYPNAILELFRIHDILPYNCIILSEEPGDGDPENLVEKYKDYIKFFPIIYDNLSNIDILYNNIDSILKENINIGDKKQFINIINNSYIKNLYFLFYGKIRFQDYPLNILIRNTYRPNYSYKCIYTILKQTNQNFKIIMCYDDDNCLHYLEKYKNNEKIEIFKAENVDKNNKAFYNLYCNQLLDRVKDGWIIFLDDDDRLALPYTIDIIEDNLNNINDFLFWKVKLGSRIIYPQDINNIQLNFVSGIGFCFHSKFKNLARWDVNKGSDYRFITKLLQNNVFNKKFRDQILTANQDEENTGLLGKKEPLMIESLSAIRLMNSISNIRNIDVNKIISQETIEIPINHNKNLMAVIPIYGRESLVYYTIKRLLNVNKISKVICVYWNENEKKTILDAGGIPIKYKNEPLGEKWNFGYQYCKNYDPDGILFVGSSDWISNEWINNAVKYIDDPNIGIIGKRDFHMLDINKKNIRTVYWSGYSKERYYETIGIGRILTRSFLKKINYLPFNNNLNRSLDNSMYKKCIICNLQQKIIDNSNIKDNIVLSLSCNLWNNKHSFDYHYLAGCIIEKNIDKKLYNIKIPSYYNSIILSNEENDILLNTFTEIVNFYNSINNINGM